MEAVSLGCRTLVPGALRGDPAASSLIAANTRSCSIAARVATVQPAPRTWHPAARTGHAWRVRAAAHLCVVAPLAATDQGHGRWAPRACPTRVRSKGLREPYRRRRRPPLRVATLLSVPLDSSSGMRSAIEFTIRDGR